MIYRINNSSQYTRHPL